MYINRVTPHYFRAFGNGASISLSQQITIFYGGNGSGKSSFAEALEWLFYGYTKRRRKGDGFSKTEYKDSYINKGCPSGEAPYVEADVTFQDGTIHTVRRVMTIDERGRVIEAETKSFIDQEEVSDFLALGVLSDAQCPIVVQHGIQDFIHSRPIDRYRTISEALGLSDLTKFKEILEKARNQYKNSPPQKVSEARQILKQAVKHLEKIQLNEISKRWQKKDVDINPYDMQSVYEKSRQYTGSAAESHEDLLKTVKERQIVEMSKLFDVMPFRPQVNQNTTIKGVQGTGVQLFQQIEDLYVAAGDLAKIVVEKYSEAQLGFWRQGLDQLNLGDDLQNVVVECPFCGEMTLSEKKIEAIRARSNGNQEFNEKQQKVRELASIIQKNASALDDLVSKTEVAALSEEQIQALQKMFSQDQEKLENFAKIDKEYVAAWKDVKGSIAKLSKAIMTCQSKDLLPENSLQAAKSVVVLGQELKESLPMTFDKLEEYSRVFAEFHPILQRELSDEDTVAIFTSLIALLSLAPSFDLLVRAKNFDAEVLRSQQKAGEYILNCQRDMVEKREQDILLWYGLLSPNPDVKFTGLVPGKDEYNLKATAFGRELNAAASLSQSQLNCLGLSVYIPSIVADDAPFRFIVFDDPVQAMDDEHHESFLINVVPELIGNRSRQVVVLTHLKPTADRLRNLNYESRPVYYKFDKLISVGPQIKQYIVFKDETDQIQDLLVGNEASRSIAVAQTRILCEIIMREMYAKTHHTPMPDELQSPRQMQQVFRKLKGVTQGHAKQILDTIDWSDPSHHTDPTWQTPDSSDIKLHLDRLQSIISSLKLRSE